MDSRREFLKKAAMLSGGTALFQMLPPVILKALAIDPAPGSSWKDAEHIVFLMQENRSFDHIFGSLQGVRGFNDPRAIKLPNGNPVWKQTDKNGNVHAPFRLNTLESKAFWMGSLPHTWSDQTDARNDGKYDRWLEVKQARRKDYADLPLTLGYGTREDFLFYYSLADAFTVCDHNFCSSITGTHPNRYYWMTGSLRENPADVTSKDHVYNITDDYKPELSWTTYPERLEAAGVSWKIYQNELSMGFGIADEEWLSNFGTNVLEYFEEYNVRLHPGRIASQGASKERLLRMIDELQKAPASDEAAAKRLAAARKLLDRLATDQSNYTTQRYEALTTLQKALNARAFTTNTGDPFFHEVSPLEFEEGGVKRSINIPKGDLLHQFRQDVANGQLPTVSWLSSPANFSDHPSLPWYGPWYVSEVMEILLKNPEVWKKTIVVITYDENDGYFDHLPPFVVPHPTKPESGKVSAGIDPRHDFSVKDQQVNPSASPDRLRDAPLGLGYRVPMIIASPWSRGGYVNSEVFDHTSSLQFLERFLKQKTGKEIRETNITEWRRTICGDLTSVFRPYEEAAMAPPASIQREAFIEKVHEAQNKPLPAIDPAHLPQQEKGIRPACALPYELYCDGQVDRQTGKYVLSFRAANKLFGAAALGAPFYVYTDTPYRGETLHCRNYAVKPGDGLEDGWELAGFEGGRYHLRVHGPNGFFREFRGDGSSELMVSLQYYRSNPALELLNSGKTTLEVTIRDNSYKGATRRVLLKAGNLEKVDLDCKASYGWYDRSVLVKGQEGFEIRYAGKVETGTEGKTDPLMGGVIA
jgi:phospholipase C